MVVLATNPIFAEQSREVRGYSLLVLCSIISTLCVLNDKPGSLLLLATAAAIATHLYGFAVLVAQVLWLVKEGRLSNRFRAVLGVGATVGMITYLPLLKTMLGASRGRVFRPGFPVDLAWEALGSSLPAVLLTSLLVGIGLYGALRTAAWQGPAPTMFGFGLLALVVPWLVMQPFDLYPRFYVWAVPLIGVAAARATALDSRLLLVAILTGVLALIPQLEHWSMDELTARQARVHLAELRGEACLLGWSAEAAAVYLPEARWVRLPDQLAGCEGALALLPHQHPELVRAAREEFAVEVWLSAARREGVVFVAPTRQCVTRSCAQSRHPGAEGET